jgi:hypothetical protein
VVCLDRPSYVYEPRMVNRFKVSQRYIANAIGAACNSRIPAANLHAGLNFVNFTGTGGAVCKGATPSVEQ